MKVKISEKNWKVIGVNRGASIQIGQDPKSNLWYIRIVSHIYGDFVDDNISYDTEQEANLEALKIVQTGELPY
jgi:hypothetical protein